jgi:hypothetical protein
MKTILIFLGIFEVFEREKRDHSARFKKLSNKPFDFETNESSRSLGLAPKISPNAIQEDSYEKNKCSLMFIRHLPRISTSAVFRR